MKNPSQYHIQKRKDGRYAVTVMFKGKRQSIYGKTKKQTLEKLTKVINDIQYAKIHNLQNFSAAAALCVLPIMSAPSGGTDDYRSAPYDI